MRIVLLRHGKPKIDLHSMRRNRCSSANLGNLINSYNLVGISDDDKVTDEVIELAATCDVLIHSDLLRSIDSARMLGQHDIMHYSDSIFREPTLPFANWNYPRLTLFTWFILFRALWYLGYSNNAESISSTRKRAVYGATKLKNFADKHGSVILVGHGVINRFIAKELLYSGWKGPKTPGNNYWDYGIYEYIAT